MNNLAVRGVLPNVRFVEVDGIIVVEAVNVCVRILFKNAATGKVAVEVIPREKLTKSYLRRRMLKNGVVEIDADIAYRHIMSQTNKLLVLSEMGNTVAIFQEHLSLGWSAIEGGLAFKADAIYKEDGVVVSAYTGSVNIQSGGSLQAFVDMLKVVLKDNIPMQSIVAMASAATVLPFANAMWGTKIDNPINHIYSTSSMGKSTAAELFVALGSSPSKNDGFMLTFSSTNNALMKQVEGIMGYPVAVDELSSSTRKALTEMVYTLANGTGRVRCTAGGMEITESRSYQTVFLSTGESGMVRKCVKTEGISARVFEFGNIFWTTSAEESEQISEVAKKNYGVVTPAIAQELLRNGDKWKLAFATWLLCIKERIKAEKLIIGVGDRVANIIALYMASLEILNTIFQLDYDIVGVFEFFWLHIMVKLAEDSNLAIRAYDAIIRHFARYRKERYVDELTSTMMKMTGIIECQSDKEGMIISAKTTHKDVRGNVYGSYVVFYPDMLEKILEDNGFIEPKVVLKSLRKDQLLKTKDENRDYMEMCLEGVETRVYAVWIQDYSYSGYSNGDDINDDIM